VGEVGGVGGDKSDNVTLDPPRRTCDPNPSRDTDMKVKVGPPTCRDSPYH